MTKRELKQIYYLNREIEMWKKELDKLNNKSIVGTPAITGMPGGGGMSNPAADLAMKKTEIEDKINKLLLKIQIQRKNIMEYISGIDDSLMRQIIYYRHILCMRWDDVAAHIGGGNTGDSARMIYSRFFDYSEK